MKRILRHLPLIVLVLFAIWAGKGIFSYEIYYTQDIKHHLLRSYDAVITLSEGVLPMRWAGILNYECGVPMYNFYNPLLYYLAAGIYFFVDHLIVSLKLISFLSLVLGPVFFYFWILRETGSKLSAFASGFVYLFAPYTLLLVYVRGSPEYLAYAIAPLVFYFYAKAFSVKDKRGAYLNLFFASCAGALVAISHNVVFILLLPVIFVYLLVKMFLGSSSNVLGKKVVSLSFISILGLSAFFIFPAVFEKHFTQLDVPIFNYADHFPTLGQVFNSKWGYGDSAIGVTDDAMSFQLGYAQWLLVGSFVLWIFYSLVTKKTKKNILALVFWLIAVVSLFFVLPWSLPVWEKLPLLQQIQFSWRILGICVFATSAILGFWLSRVKARGVRVFLFVVFCFLAFWGNRNHLLPQPVYEDDLPFYRELDQISGKRRFLTANATTILPPSAELSCYFTTPVVQTSDRADVLQFREVSRGSSYGDLRVSLDKKIVKGDFVVVNLGYYPEMFDLKLNGNSYEYLDCGGLVCLRAVDMVDGENAIVWRVVGTPLERFFNFVSLVFVAVWGYIILRVRKKSK